MGNPISAVLAKANLGKKLMLALSLLALVSPFCMELFNQPRELGAQFAGFFMAAVMVCAGLFHTTPASIADVLDEKTRAVLGNLSMLLGAAMGIVPTIVTALHGSADASTKALLWVGAAFGVLGALARASPTEKAANAAQVGGA